IQTFLPEPAGRLQIDVRTGDTPASDRRQLFHNPPDILLTTPESLAVLLTQSGAASLFASLQAIVVDEVHSLAACKRGADLALTLERLENLSDQAPQRIGLSATCAPVAEAARFLVGCHRPCSIIQVPDTRPWDLIIEPLEEREEVGSQSGLWAPLSFVKRLVGRLELELRTFKTTLIFTNTRGLAERLTWALKRSFPGWQEVIAVHHSAVSGARRREVERRLKEGQ